MPLPETRTMIRAVLGRTIVDDAIDVDPLVRLAVPRVAPGGPADVLVPRSTWSEATEHARRQARRLAGMFRDNFARYADQASAEIDAAFPEA